MTVKEVIKQPVWAVVGATTNPERYGNKVIKKLVSTDHRVIPINPSYDEVEGLTCYPSLLEVNQQIDVVMLIVNPAVGIKAVEAAISLGIKTLWVQPGATSPAIETLAESAGIQVIHSCILTY